MKETAELGDFDPENLRKGAVEIIDTAFVDGRLLYKVKELDKHNESIWINSATFAQYNPAVLTNFYCRHLT